MSDSERRIRVLLLFGGRSAEHDVSRVSAVAAAKALDPTRYEVVPVAITKDGRWLTAGEARAAIEAGPDALPVAFDVEGDEVPAASVGSTVASTRPDAGVASGGALGADVVLPLIHGPYGEDGTVQGMLELAGIPYVGAGVLGSAVGMDKVTMKQLFRAAALPIVASVEFRESHIGPELLDRIESELGFPCFVKPSNMGSSVGVSKARDRDQLTRGIDLALAYDEWVIVEEAITGREIEVGILGDDPPEVSEAGEIVPGDEFYTYADKYEDGTAQLLAPAPITDEQRATVRSLAVRAFEACRCEAMARVDFFLEEQRPDGGPGRGFLLNEVNTIPGFTPISMYPRLWDISGVPYPKLLDRLIELALDRHARRARRAGRQR
ncbi:MAG TPA: D-alanine--D-alanine ligase family protein [Acidimicrobiia bacterium]